MRHRSSQSERRERFSPRLVAALVFFGYVAVSVAYFGRHVLLHPGRSLVGTSGSEDPEKFVWWFEWWPHAIGSWTNPFDTHAIFAPTGVNLVWTTSVPALALAFTPLTVLFSPTISYNVAAVLLPAISAWTAFRLLVYATESIWASMIGGYLYGFSSYVLGHQLAGHLNLTSGFLVPLVVLVVLRFLRGDLSRKGLTVRLGALVALQAYVSTEVATTLTLMLLVAFVLAFALVPDLRQRLVSAISPAVGAYALAAALVAPLIFYGLLAGVPPALTDASAYNADLLNLGIPTSTIGVNGHTFASIAAHFPGGINEQDSYLGVPTLLVVVLALLRRWSPAVRFLFAVFVVATLLSFGTALHVDGHRVLWLPWSALSDAPVLNNVIPSRIALYATLAAAALVAVWIANTPGLVFTRPYVLPALAVAALVPACWSGAFVQQPQRLAFFQEGLYKGCVPRGETLLIFPFGNTGWSMLWQAESRFWFDMTEGDVGTHYPSAYLADPTVNVLVRDVQSTSSLPMSDLLALAQRRRVDRVISAEAMGSFVPGTTSPLAGPFPNEAQMRVFGRSQQVGDVIVSPACSSQSLTSAAPRG